MSDGWFARHKETTYWEFSLDGLTEEQAIELDRRIREVVDAFEAALNDSSDSKRTDG